MGVVPARAEPGAPGPRCARSSPGCSALARSTTADFDRLPYTQAVFRESLRLYPPVWALARIATRPYDLGRYRVPEGGTIVMSQWVVHRRGAYFADPLRFAPGALAGRPAAAGGRLLPVRRRVADVHRGAVRDARGHARARGHRPHLAGRPEPGAPHIDARFTLRPRHGLPARVQAA